MAQRILLRREVEACTGLSRSTIYLRIKQGKFPAPISLGENSGGWLESEIAEWINERVRASRMGQPA
jgi:prophage regulatory protein